MIFIDNGLEEVSRSSVAQVSQKISVEILDQDMTGSGFGVRESNI